MSLTGNKSLVPQQAAVEVPENATVEAGATGAEAFPLTAANFADNLDWTYSATAEDNGTAGVLDLQPGLIFAGEAGGVAIQAAQIDLIEHAIAPPETADEYTVALFKNSTPIQYADEGFVVQTGAAIEFNVGPTYIDMAEGDVLRLGLIMATGDEVGEVDFDLDASGTLVIK